MQSKLITERSEEERQSDISRMGSVFNMGFFGGLIPCYFIAQSSGRDWPIPFMVMAAMLAAGWMGLIVLVYAFMRRRTHYQALRQAADIERQIYIQTQAMRAARLSD